MDPIASPYRASREQLAVAVHHNEALSREGLLERLFTYLFSGLVYPQIWEDPIVDMDALCINRRDHVVAIASGGCNVASYLVAQPAQITAVDLNAAHIALNKMKLAAIQHLPSHGALLRFFGDAADPRNVGIYDQHIAPHLDTASRAYWEDHSLLRGKRISQFSKGFYRHGLLGTFIGVVHFLARAHGYDLRRVLEARTMEEQREAYNRHVAPLFEKPVIKWLAGHPPPSMALAFPLPNIAPWLATTKKA